MTGILLVPSAEWRERLLAGSVFGSPPTASRVRWVGDDFWGRWMSAVGMEWNIREATHRQVNAREDALVLAWDGAVIPEGMDRARRIFAESQGVDATRGLLWFASEWYGGRAFALSGASPGALICTAHPSGRVGRLDSDTFGAPDLAIPPEETGELRLAWALAVCCEACGIGRVSLRLNTPLAGPGREGA